MDVCASTQQHVYSLCVPMIYSGMQRRRTIGARLGIDVRRSVKQFRRKVDASADGGPMQRRHSVNCCCIDVGTRGQQMLGNVGVPTPGRRMQGGSRVHPNRCSIHLGACRKQRLGDVFVAVLGSGVKCCYTIAAELTSAPASKRALTTST